MRWGRVAPMETSTHLAELCEAHGILALYLFGSRADEGLRALASEPAERGGSDLDVGVVFSRRPQDPLSIGSLQVAMEDLFAPLRVDLVPLQRVDALFQFAAISGHRVAALDSTQADEFELETMRRASELLPVQRRVEIDLFGATSR